MLLACQVQGATSASELTLPEVTDLALARFSSAATDDGVPPFSSATWLAALPSIAFSYLDSDDRNGTDETELSLTLPFKSPHLRRQDDRLAQLTESIAAAEQELRRLYLSGLLREALWSHRIARARVDQSARKIRLLETLLDRQQQLFAAGTEPRYALLLLQQELVDARLSRAEAQRDAGRWLRRYQSLTGLGVAPASLEEAPPPGTGAPQFHPALRLLDLGWERDRALILAGSRRSAPWQLSAIARELETPGLSETQYGLAVELPLSLFDAEGGAVNSAWREASRRYWRERDELVLALKASRDQLQEEGDYLRRRQSLLQQSTEISERLLRESAALRDLNELGQEVWIRRTLNDLDRQLEAELNRLLLGQQRALSRQAAGLPL